MMNDVNTKDLTCDKTSSLAQRVWMRAGEGRGGKQDKMGDGGKREWLGGYYSSWRVGTQSVARREAHCAGV